MKRMLSLILAFAISCASLAVFAEGGYSVSDWAKEELKKAEEMKIIPESLLTADLREDITRAEFAAVSVKLYEYLSKETAKKTEENPFEDTADEYVLKAYNLGLTTGTSEKEFSPDGVLTREQAATMLTRVYKKITVKEWSIDNDADLTYDEDEKFADDESISSWAKASVYFMASKGIIKGVGDNKFAPKNFTDEEKSSGYANASREQAILMAVRMTKLDIKKTDAAENANPDPYAAGNQNLENVSKKNAYTVAFIGGSLTEGGAMWIAATAGELKKKMPDKEIVTINAGKGGTGSEYGAARFMTDVGAYEPDMVVIEFAVNDSGTNEKGHKAYMESMVRQAKNLSKEPTVIFLYAPIPAEKDDASYKTWLQGVAWKEEIAKHYGIKSINVYDYMQEDYNNIKEEKGYKTFTDYLKKMYQQSGSGFNVHGGYGKYAEAIKKAFEEDYDGCMAKPKDVGVCYAAEKKLVEAKYNFLTVDSAEMRYAGDWKTYDANYKFETSDANATIPEKHYKYPFFTHGIKQAMKTKAGFGFYTKAGSFSLNFTAATVGSTAKVYLDDAKTEYASLSCYSPYHGVNYMTKWVDLPNDGKKHKVIIIVDKPTTSNYVFRFGGVFERFYN